MQLPGRVSAAIEVLDAMAQSHRPASVALADWGKSHRFAGAGDRAAIGNLVYDALRRKASHAFAMGSDSPRSLVLSVLVRDWGEDSESVAALCDGGKFSPAPLTPEELSVLKNSDPLAGAPDHVRADIPEWVAPHFRNAFGDDWIAEGQGMTGRPSLDMRVNTLKADRQKVMKSLKRFEPEEGRLALTALRLPAGTRDARTPNVQVDEAYLKGWFEVQDEGSQLVSLLAGAEPGNQVLDYCAGAGGKSLALAALLANTGQIFAHDADRTRLAPIYDRIKRSGARNIQTRPPEPGALDELNDRMDLVVVDAPCTGTGTWRRRPDTKWRLDVDQMNQRCSEQRQILEEAAKFVKPGGRLHYITCSVLPPENDGQVAAFLKGHPGFEVEDIAALAPAAHQVRCGVMLSPARTATDGFYAARLVRRS